MTGGVEPKAVFYILAPIIVLLVVFFVPGLQATLGAIRNHSDPVSGILGILLSLIPTLLLIGLAKLMTRSAPDELQFVERFLLRTLNAHRDPSGYAP